MSRSFLLCCMFAAACSGKTVEPDDTDTQDTITNDDDNAPPNLLAARVEPSPIDFGEVPAGEERTIEVELRNGMDVDWEIADVSLLPAGEAVNLPLSFHTAIANGLVIAPDETYTFEIFFQSEIAVSYDGNLDIILPVGARKSVQVKGVGLAPPEDTDDTDDTN